MPKKIKLNLDDLKVQSFVTSLSGEDMKKLKGASAEDTDCAVCGVTNAASCNTDCFSCIGTCAATACLSCDTRCGTGCATCRPSYCSGYVCC